jgi:hypothetical protein
MNFIKRIREAMNDNCQVVKFSFWNGEAAVYLFEKEIPISVFPNNNKVILDVEGYDWKLDVGEVIVISKVMEILLDSMVEIKELTKKV